MKFQDVDGTWKMYPPSFKEKDKDRLVEFVNSHTMICTMRVLYELREPITDIDSDVICIRHDVDHSLEHAMKFARWESENGISATYFVLHTAFYYKNKIALYGWMEELQELGHEVGLHLDTVNNNLVNGVPNYVAAAEQLDIELSELRHRGFDIVGSAAHGNPKSTYSDEQLIATYGPEFFGLQYEAYELQRRLNVNYISDNHGQWHAPLKKKVGKATVMLLHPCHWPFK